METSLIRTYVVVACAPDGTAEAGEDSRAGAGADDGGLELIETWRALHHYPTCL